MKKLSIIGNPVYHSQSPKIYKMFAQEVGIDNLIYEKILSPINKFEKVLKKFFKNGGYGANITAPFKENAFYFCNAITNNSTFIGAINVIKKKEKNIFLGSNTDGIGLVADLNRLGFLHKEKMTILVIGAGGAARGIIVELLSYNHKVIVVNRNLMHVKTLVNSYKDFGEVCFISYEYLMNYEYDIIINTVSTNTDSIIRFFPKSLISTKTLCYDICYQFGDTVFINWCRYHGAKHYANGIGMLVMQAAYSFFLWYNIFPPIDSVLKFLFSKFRKI